MLWICLIKESILFDKEKKKDQKTMHVYFPHFQGEKNGAMAMRVKKGQEIFLS